MTKEKYPAKGLDDEMGFGQYSDFTLWEVLNRDPEYIQWLMSESRTFHMENEAYEFYKSLGYE